MSGVMVDPVLCCSPVRVELHSQASVLDQVSDSSVVHVVVEEIHVV